MNSREKGKRGERQWRDELRANGYDARRGQQFAGGPESPDVVCPALPWFHFEVKVVERLNIWDAMKQAIRDALGKIGIVAHKRNFGAWLVTMEAGTFFRLLRGDFLTEDNKGNEEGATSPQPKADPHFTEASPAAPVPERETAGAAQQFGDDVEVVPTNEENNNNERKETEAYEDKRQ
jgi:hypothetical protein